MINISQEEFYERIESLINGKTSRAKLIKELETDTSTLNNKIQELSAYNLDLYLRFIEKFPYKSKSRDDIDYEALIIEIVKTSMTTDEVAVKYDLGERTVRRKAKEIEKENPDLIAIYKVVKKNNQYGRENSLELQRKIDELVLRPVKISGMNEGRKKQLEEIEKIFNNRCQYMSKEEAANSMGMTANRMYKLLNELYRIKIEENFKDSLKFNSSITTIKIDTSEGKSNNKEINKEGEVK